MYKLSLQNFSHCFFLLSHQLNTFNTSGCMYKKNLFKAWISTAYSEIMEFVRVAILLSNYLFHCCDNRNHQSKFI